VVYYVKKPIRVEYYPKTEEIIDNIEDIQVEELELQSKVEEPLQRELKVELQEELQLELQEKFINEEIQLKLEEELEEENDMLIE